MIIKETEGVFMNNVETPIKSIFAIKEVVTVDLKNIDPCNKNCDFAKCQ